jgi:nitrilase
MSRVTVAVVQAGSAPFDPVPPLEKLERYAREARDAGARLAVFPEAFIGGYPKGLDFGVRIGSRSGEGREAFRRYAAGAIDLPGPETEAIAAVASEIGIDLVVGVIERDGGTLYCTAIFVTARGGLAATHRKLMPTAGERIIWGFGDGSTLSVIDEGYGVVGSAICWENYMPLLRAAMYAQGVQIWCAPTVDDREVWQATMRHIAVEGRCFVLGACQFLRRSDLPADLAPVQGDDPDTVLIRGGSVIVSPFGEVLAGPLYGEEGVLVAEIDLDERIGGTFDLDVVGHYARPDVFTLQVDTRERRAVSPG